MSFCRWSSDNFKCDLYVYESQEGYVVHVAGNRLVGDAPKYPDLKATPEEWREAGKIHSEFMRNAEREDIDLPHAGEMFIEEGLDGLLYRLEYLKNLGYRFPDYVMDSVKREMRDEQRVV